jgi:hypothetical protein
MIPWRGIAVYAARTPAEPVAAPRALIRKAAGTKSVADLDETGAHPKISNPQSEPSRVS